MMIRTNQEDQSFDYKLFDHFLNDHFARYLTPVPSVLYSKSYQFVYDDMTSFLLSFYPKFSEPTNYGFRLEFNPNKIDFAVLKVFLGKIIGYFPRSDIKDMIKFNRLDIAIDYPVNLNPSLVLVPSVRKGFVASGSKGVESVYFGHRSSDFFLRVYNKKLELKQKQKTIYQGEHLWRIELEMKKDFHINQSIEFIFQYFDKISVMNDSSLEYEGKKFNFNCCQNTGDWALDLVLYKASSQGFTLNTVLKEIPERTRYRYKQKLFLKMARKPVIDPKRDIRQQLPEVYHNFTQKIMCCLAT